MYILVYSTKNNRETEASGLGWELFSQYVRALREAQPKYFIYENNKSMSKEIKASITETFGFEPILINSALVSAQNRQRLYWVGKRNEDGTYSKVDIEQPEDRGILLKDILEDGIVDKEKAYCLKHQAGNARDYFKKHHTQIKFEPVGTTNGKAFCLTGNYQGAYPEHTLSKSVRSMVAEPVRVGCFPSPDGTLKNSQGMRLYSTEGKSVNLTALGGGMGAKTGLYAVPIEYNPLPTGKVIMTDNGFYCVDSKGVTAQGYTVTKTDKKAPTLISGQASKMKIIEKANGKEQPIYEVKGGLITIKGKQYPIKLADGFYIIRKLTVRECMRLQTVPEWYQFPVSNSQAYKMLGNGWTVDVISHLLKGTMQNKK